MTYEEALRFIKTSYDKEFNLQLDRIRELMAILGNPQDELRIIHVAGTNGKGSVCAMTAEILKQAGYNVGMFTSPVILDYKEQFKINGEMISEDEFVSLSEEICSACDGMIPGNLSDAGEEINPIYRPSEFEKAVALAFKYFRNRDCDFVILEVGMGGDFDATNVISKSELSVIVNIDYDHMHFLGDTLEEIADKKAGIIKGNGCVVVADQSEAVLNVIKKRALEKGAEYRQTDCNCICDSADDLAAFSYKNYEDIHLSLLGNHQKENAAIVLELVECLMKKGYNIPRSAVYEGLSNTVWPGRFELVSDNPVIIIDGAHNPDGIEALYDNLTTYFPGEKFIFVTGILGDKDYSQMIRKMTPLADVFITIEPNNPRAMSSENCVKAIEDAGFDGWIIDGFALSDDSTDYDLRVYLAMDMAKEISRSFENKKPICAFGSLYSVGALRNSI